MDKKRYKNSIEIKRQKDDSLIVIVRKDGQRTTLPFDSPDLDIYRPGIEPDDVQTFDEVACKQGAYGTLEKDEFIRALLA